MSNKLLNILNDLVVTFLYLGKIKYCPGTVGSIAAFPLALFISYLAVRNKITFSTLDFPEFIAFIPYPLPHILLVLLISSVVLFIIGIFCTHFYLKTSKVNFAGTKDLDPKEVIIDEVAGQVMVITFAMPSFFLFHASSLGSKIHMSTALIISLFFAPLILFRIFDILKPWPINVIDKNIKGALGVMLDDFVAAVFAIVSQYAIILFICDLF